jgi:hypothetical protein
MENAMIMSNYYNFGCRLGMQALAIIEKKPTKKPMATRKKEQGE